MTNENPYLLDELENAELLEIDGLYSWQFSLDDGVLDQADVAAEADLPFASEEILLRIELLDGRALRKWQFSYNQVLEAQYRCADGSWSIADAGKRYQLRCQVDVAASADNQD